MIKVMKLTYHATIVDERALAAALVLKDLAVCFELKEIAIQKGVVGE
jgi:hypothetical protein